MNPTDDLPRLERPSFFDGQRLMAHDLATAQVYNRELRWLHNRSLHGWGIAFGLAVTGARGDRAVKVDVGYAIDCLGRDLVLDASIAMPIPAVASASDGRPATYYLTVSYAEDARLAPITRAGACKASGAVRRPEMPLLRWQDPSDTDPASRYRFGLDVVLASVRILNCQLQEASTRERRDAVPPQQPYIAAGRTPAGDTAWRLWPNDSAAVGVATRVSTSEAGFRTTPRYQAHVVGERMYQPAAAGETFLVDGYAQVGQTTASSFDLRIVLPEGTSAGIGQEDTFRMDDYRAVASRITNVTGTTAELLIAFNGPVLAVGQTLFTYVPIIQPLGQLGTNDFKGPLENISARNGIRLDALLGANGWNQDLSNLVVVLGQPIAIPGPALTLNPGGVFKPEFMDVLRKDLAWHVVWTGVEG